MKTPCWLFLCLLAVAQVALAVDRVSVTVTHTLAVARPSETITLPWSEITKAMPGVYLQHIEVKDARGRVLPYQVTNIAPQSKDPRNEGIAYGELIFQYDFAAGEKSATFTIEKIADVAPVFPVKAYARQIPERLDDFAWENDKIAHRTYGPALAAAPEPGVAKEVLVTSGIDVWCKRVSYPIVDRWYNKGHDHYHHDEGEGMDMYQVGTSRGCGGTGVWDGQRLHPGRNYKTWKIITNGPVRTVFELTYDTWATGAGFVSETKRFTLDAGHQLTQVESTFIAHTGPKEITVAIGVNKNSGDKGQESKGEVTKDAAGGWLAQWEVQKVNGSLGEAIVVVGEVEGFVEDTANQLVLAKVVSGKPLRYFIGAAWSKAGEFTTRDAWSDYVAAQAARAKDPVKVALSVAP